MLYIRPIEQDDDEALHALARASGVGFTSLPDNATKLKHKIAQSCAAFAAGEHGSSLRERRYLMVAVDSSTQQVVGCSGIEAAVGLVSPFYHYHLGKVVHASRQLNIYNTVETLTLSNDYTGASELCSLFLLPAYRKGHHGRLLSKCRFLFMRLFPQCFSEMVIAELRGYHDAQGHSPFWQWLEAHFFGIDFNTADYLSGIGRKAFIAELMPRYPIYVNLLSQAAQDAIARVHPHTAPAKHLLEGEGFSHHGYIDIFDAGPTLECSRTQIATIKHSQLAKVKISESCANAQFTLCSNTRFSQFRAGMILVQQDSSRNLAFLSANDAAMLNLSEGDPILLSH